MLSVSLVFIGLMLVIANALVHSPKYYNRAASVAFYGLMLSFPILCLGGLFPASIVASVALWTISRGCASRGASVFTFRWLSLAAALVGVASGAAFSLPHVIQMHELQVRYPVVPIGERLAYERVGNDPKAANTAVPAAQYGPPPSNARAWTNLAFLESQPERSMSNLRSAALAQIHASTLSQFLEAPGFGIGRMGVVEYFMYRKLKETRKAAAPLHDSPKDASPVPPSGMLHVVGTPRLRTEETDAPRFEDQLWKLHIAGLNDFGDPQWTGLLIDRGHAAGFEPHGFSDRFQPEQLSAEMGEPNWTLTRLELVSLWKTKDPRVYLSGRKLPQMDELRAAPTRSVNPFESAAIALLVKGEDLAYDEQPGRLLALGSIRALDQCTQCHSVKRGALLGAFSYEFHGPLTKTRDQKRPGPRT